VDLGCQQKQLRYEFFELGFLLEIRGGAFDVKFWHCRKILRRDYSLAGAAVAAGVAVKLA
jgi:hypothetical protein